MAITLLADANIIGHVDRPVKRMQGEPWLEFWRHLQMSYVSFADVGLDPADSDAVVWHRCQEKRLCLLTSNRNNDGPGSLENTIRLHGTPESLPVFTIGDADRTLSDREYCGSDLDVDRLLAENRRSSWHRPSILAMTGFQTSARQWGIALIQRLHSRYARRSNSQAVGAAIARLLVGRSSA